MIETLTTSEMAHRLHNDEYSSFSIDGAFALVEYLEELEEELNEQIEFDLIAIRCDFTEYESLEEFRECYFGNDGEVPEFDDPQDLGDWLRNYIEERSEIIDFDGGLIIRTF